MRILNKNGIELLESEIDFTLGYLSEGTAIKVDAEPIDNITKFAWDDDDYEVVQYYHLYANEVGYNSAPTPQDDTDAMLVDHEYRLTMLEIFADMEV